MDIRCVVCGEPWDAYGVNHGDMEKWEADLFKKGAGCPSCEGVRPEQPWEPTSIFDIENGDEDPGERLSAWEDANSKNPPKWEKPEDVALWTCSDCGVSAVRDANDELDYAGGQYRYNREDPAAEPAHVFDGNTGVCPACLRHCTECNEPVSPKVQDLEAAGACVQVHTGSYYSADYCCCDCIPDFEYKRQLDAIDNNFSYHIDSKYTAAELHPSNEDDWQVKVFQWLWGNDLEALETADNYTYLPNLTLRRVLPALVELDLLEEDSELLLRDVDLDGYRLQMWDCREKQRGDCVDRRVVYYRFTHPDGRLLFSGDDYFTVSPGGDESVRGLLTFLTLQPGDTDDEYFEKYSPEQLQWARESAEQLQMWSMEVDCDCGFDGPDPGCEECAGSGLHGNPPLYDHEGEWTIFKPWGWKGPEDETT